MTLVEVVGGFGLFIGPFKRETAIENWMDELEEKKTRLLSLLKEHRSKDTNSSMEEQLQMKKKIVLGQIDLIENQISTLSKLDMISESQAHEREELHKFAQPKTSLALEPSVSKGSKKMKKLRPEELRRKIGEEMAKLVSKEKKVEEFPTKKKEERKPIQKIGKLVIEQKSKCLRK